MYKSELFSLVLPIFQYSSKLSSFIKDLEVFLCKLLSYGLESEFLFLLQWSLQHFIETNQKEIQTKALSLQYIAQWSSTLLQMPAASENLRFPALLKERCNVSRYIYFRNSILYS